MDNKLEYLDYCLYCKSGQLKPLFSAPNRFDPTDQAEYSICRCLDCGLVFQNPRVKEEHISSYYKESLGYYTPAVIKINFKNKVKSLLEKWMLINHFDYHHLGSKNIIIKLIVWPIKFKYNNLLIPNFVKGGQVFELGCSHGANLLKLKQNGWRVIGSDLDFKSIEIAKKHGLDVYCGRGEDLIIKLEKNKYDAVCAGMVIEHVYNPFQVLNSLTDLLKPDGQLIFSIPYFNGLEYKIFGRYSYGLHLPHHITFLNKKIIRDYLRSLGYKKITFHFHNFDRDIVSSAEYRYKEKGGLIFKLLSSNKIIRTLLIKPFVYLISRLGLSSRVTIRAIKG